MALYLVPGIVLFLSLAGIVGILVRRLPEIVLLDVESIVKARERRVKHDILRTRAERTGRETVRMVRSAMEPTTRALQTAFRNAYDAVLALERKARTIGGGATKLASGDDRLRILMGEAEELWRRGNAREAERKYIEAVSVNPKYVKAYENLGRLYIREKQWTEAEEAFRFVLKLDATDASAHANLGELEEAKGNLIGALPHYQKAVELKPANPKYLDLLLDAAIRAGNRDLARGTFARLKDVNPENQKLPIFEQRIREM